MLEVNKKDEELVTPGLIDGFVQDDMDMFITELEIGLLESGLTETGTFRSILLKLFSGNKLESMEKSVLNSFLKNTDIISALEKNIGEKKLQSLIKYIDIILIKSQIIRIMEEESTFDIDTVDGKKYLVEKIGEKDFRIGVITMTLDKYFVVKNLLNEENYLIHKELGTVRFSLNGDYKKSVEDSGFLFLWNDDEITVFRNPSNMHTFPNEIEGLKTINIIDNNDNFSTILQLGDKILYTIGSNSQGEIEKDLILESDDAINKILHVYYMGRTPIIKCSTSAGKKYFVGGEDGLCLNPDNYVDNIKHNDKYFLLRTENQNGTKNLDIYKDGKLERIIENKSIDYVGRGQTGNIFTMYGEGKGGIYVVEPDGSVDFIDIGSVDKVKMFSQKYENPNIPGQMQRFFEFTKGNIVSLVNIDLGEDKPDLEDFVLEYQIGNLKKGDDISHYGFKFFEKSRDVAGDESDLYIYAGKLKRDNDRKLMENNFQFEVFSQNVSNQTFESILEGKSQFIPGDLVLEDDGIHIIPKDFSVSKLIEPGEAEFFQKNVLNKAINLERNTGYKTFFSYNVFKGRGKFNFFGKLQERFNKYYGQI